MSAVQERASDFQNIERRVIKIREACIRVATRPVLESPIASAFVAITASGTIETSLIGIEPEFADTLLAALDKMRARLADMIPPEQEAGSNVVPLHRARA